MGRRRIAELERPNLQFVRVVRGRHRHPALSRHVAVAPNKNIENTHASSTSRRHDALGQKLDTSGKSRGSARMGGA